MMILCSYHVVCAILKGSVHCSIPKGNVVLASVFVESGILDMAPSICHPHELSISVNNC